MRLANRKDEQELANDGLTYPDTEYFCKTRPVPVDTGATTTTPGVCLPVFWGAARLPSRRYTVCCPD